MSISGHHSPGEPGLVLAEVVDRVAALDEVWWSAHTDEQLVALRLHRRLADPHRRAEAR